MCLAHDCRGPRTCTTLHFFPRTEVCHNEIAAWGVEQLGLEWVPIGDASATGRELVCYATAAASENTFLAHYTRQDCNPH